MPIIRASDALEAVFNAIKSIEFADMPTLYPTEFQVDLEGRLPRYESRAIGYVFEGEMDSKLVWGARQIMIRLMIAYPVADAIGGADGALWCWNDQNQIKQTLLLLDVEGIITVDTGPSSEIYGIEGESNKVIQIPITIDYMPPEAV